MNRVLSYTKWVRKKIDNKIARSKFIGSIRSSDIFIVSYPKSGRNWVGYFLATVLNEKNNGKQQVLTLASKREYIPPVSIYGDHPSLYKYLPDPRIFVTHTQGYDSSLPNVIYLVRDPRDVIVSYWYHHKRRFQDFNLSLEKFVLMNEMWPGDWGYHVSTWINSNKLNNFLLVRYEDLQSAPKVSFQRMLEFCGIKIDEDLLLRAIDKSSFESMKRVEEENKNEDSDKGDTSIFFVRRGKSGSWQDEMNKSLSQIIYDRYSGLMEQLGYEMDD